MSVDEMLHLAEICAMNLTLLEPLRGELAQDGRYAAWQELCMSILDAARQIPDLAPCLEWNATTNYWFFKRNYFSYSFYGKVLGAHQESVFWTELVARMMEEVFGSSAATDVGEQQQRTMYEQSLWAEIENFGIARICKLHT